ncbi:ECF RNA polymerase sigma factor SigL [Planctomycetes bacterium CA13]|uniref:ECF RNA polymerase sigma factor SigL n=1 Tax=Novipirellula herctigrandis TaxID=2527986 RepID=A0A5C5YV69_9BACT|nr:ECF RNA polymerase sigma factor SigL [Planctomycetes bacterium CA13]
MRTPEFMQLLTSNQSRLYAYILSLVFDSDQADDVLQKTNIVLWEKEEQFELGSNFIAWSFRIAYFQVLAQRKQKQRERMVFDDDLIGQLAQVASQCDDTFEHRQKLMRRCLEKLNDRQREYINRRYSCGATVAKIADEMGNSVGAVKQILFRARVSLIQCVNAIEASQ